MNDAIHSVDVEIALRYAHGLGDLSPYFSGLIRGEALATHCDACKSVWFAPRLVCACQNRNLRWQRLAGSGVLCYLTSGRTVLPGTAISGEFVYGLIRLDGASNLCLGRIEIGTGLPEPNQRVRLAVAGRRWAHPSQCSDFVVEPVAP